MEKYEVACRLKETSNLGEDPDLRKQAGIRETLPRQRWCEIRTTPSEHAMGKNNLQAFSVLWTLSQAQMPSRAQLA